MTQALLLAAGQSTRTHPLTVNRPKPLLEVLDRTILEHNLDALLGVVDEVVIVVGFMGVAISERFGDEYRGLQLRYVEQVEQLGTGHALQMARGRLRDRFLVLNGDDLYSAADLAALAGHDYALLVSEVPDVTRFGAVRVEGDRVTGIVEKPATHISPYANTGAYALCADVFEIELQRRERGEYELTDYITALAAKGLVRCEVVRDWWLPVGYPWNYLEANVALLRRIAESRIDPDATIEDGVTIHGPVVIGGCSLIRSGTYIEGPVYIGRRCEIGPHAYLRPDTILLDGVRCRAEVVDSVLMRNTTAKHSSYIGHSVIGEDCNIAAGTITADYRHDGANNWSLIKGQRVDSGRRKLGAFLGDNVRLGIGTLIYPGRKIWPGQTTPPGAVVDGDLGG